MTAFLFMLLDGAKSAFGAIASWLSRRSLAELGCIVLGIVALIAILNGMSERRHSAKLQGQVVKLNAELKRISTARNVQRETTGRNIVIAERGRQKAEATARRIEAAPLPGQCLSPKEVLNADI